MTTRRSTALRLSLLLCAALATLSDASDPTTCSTASECCELCGADSYRCARGPCSTSFVTKGFFSISMPTTAVGFWDVVFSFYGMVPYLVPIALALELLLARRRRSWLRVFAFLFIPIVALVNALVLVKSLGDCAECARPCGACVANNGMPSGHATNAVGLGLWVLLELALGAGRRASPRSKALAALATVLLFAPVSYSRMYLGDHTELQVVVGSANGIVFALVYFVVLRCVVAKKLDRASQWLARGRFPITVANDFSTTKAGSPSTEETTDAASPLAYTNAPTTPV